jgi:hypothetical protein
METFAPSVTPKVSVIIPAYNTAHLVATCLDSVFAQAYRDFEVVVVNDGSPDTPELERALQPYRSRIVYMQQQNKRAAGARNTAIGKARGEFLAFLDSDDSWTSDHLAAQMQMLAQDPGLDMVYADAMLISDTPRQKTFMEKCPSEGQATFEALVVERCQIPVSTVVVRKSAIVKAGLFDENLGRCDDYDMWMRTAFHGARIGYRRTAQARLYLGRPDSLGQSSARMKETYWNILEKASQTLPLDGSQRALVDQRMAQVRAEFLMEEGKHHLGNRNPEKARTLFAEANQHLRRRKLSLAIRALEIAPWATSELIAVWNRSRLRPRGLSDMSGMMRGAGVRLPGK